MTQSCNGTLTDLRFLTCKNLHANEKPNFVPRTSPFAPGLTLRPQKGSKGEVIGTRLEKPLVNWKKKGVFFSCHNSDSLDKTLEVLIRFC